MVPVWLQPVGRMHPLVLHFPIVLWVLLALMPFLKSQVEAKSYQAGFEFLLYGAVLTTSFAALMGLFLSREPGYSAEGLYWHKVGGLALSFLGYALLLGYQRVSQKPYFSAVLIGMVGLLAAASHVGAEVTHGENFVLGPLQQSKDEAFDAEQPLFASLVMPLLEQKCNQCHSQAKSKGDLIMTSFAALMKGGEKGKVIMTDDLAESRLIQYIHLPMADDDHMPPKGKPQLTEEEKALLQAWVMEGASEEKSLTALESQAPLYEAAMALVEAKGQGEEEPAYDFSAAGEDLIASLNNPFRRLSPISAHSPALEASLFVQKAFSPQSIEELEPVNKQLVSLNLTNMPMGDEEMALLAPFKALESLNLNGTQVTEAGLRYLEGAKELQSLALSGTKVTAGIGEVLGQFPALQEVYVWNTVLDSTALGSLREQFPTLAFEQGYIPEDSEILRMSPPILENESQMIAEAERIIFKHHFPGVQIRYTLDGTEPDSLTGSLYKGPFLLNEQAQVKAIAAREGWLTSSPVAFSFFKKGKDGLTGRLLYQPHPKYRGNGPRTLFDASKGDKDVFLSPEWLGYQDSPFGAYVRIPDSLASTEKITVSFLQNISSYIMPPKRVEVWGGTTSGNMRKLKDVRPPQPDNYDDNDILAFSVPLEGEASTYRHFKVVAHPVNVLPAWHAGAGSKGWVFVDEIFVY